MIVIIIIDFSYKQVNIDSKCVYFGVIEIKKENIDHSNRMTIVT